MKFEATSQGLLGPLGHGDHQDPKEIVVWWLGLCLHCIMIHWLLNGRMEDPWVLRDPMEDHLAQAALTAAPWAAAGHHTVPPWATMALMVRPWAAMGRLMGCWQLRSHTGDQQVQADLIATPLLDPWITVSWLDVCQRTYKVSVMLFFFLSLPVLAHNSQLLTHAVTWSFSLFFLLPVVFPYTLLPYHPETAPFKWCLYFFRPRYPPGLHVLHWTGAPRPARTSWTSWNKQSLCSLWQCHWGPYGFLQK